MVSDDIGVLGWHQTQDLYLMRNLGTILIRVRLFVESNNFAGKENSFGVTITLG